jgi:replicative DNA helicase
MTIKPPARRQFDSARLTVPESEKALLAGLLDLIDRQPAVVREILVDLTPAVLTIEYGPDLLQAVIDAAEQKTPRLGDVQRALLQRTSTHRDDHEVVMQFLADLANDRFTAGPAAARLARAAAEEVQAAFNRRQQADQCLDLLHAIHDTATTPDEIAVGIDRLAAAKDAAIATSRQAATNGIVDCLDLWRRNETPPRLPTGFSPIDRNLGGGLPVGITAIAAKPKVGKSCLAGQLMLGALLHDPTLTAVWFRGEMSNDQLLCKLLATWSELRHPAIELITRRQAENRDKKAAAASLDLAMQTSGRLSIIAPPITPAKILSHLRTLKPRLVVIDYLQKVRADEGQTQRSDKRHELDDTTTRIGSMAIEFNAATIVVSQLPKAAQPEDSIGTLSKDSNLLDYEANVFATLWKQQDDGSTLFRINANRDGPEADEQLWFDGNAQFFRPAAAQEHEEFAAFAGGGR